jgi:formylglycine-generating enzyme required for sulfatase activity
VGSPEDEPGRFDWEWPRQNFEFSPGVWIGETEVTQGQWKALGLKNPSRFQNCGDDCPVENVNWFEAAEFANRLSDKEELDRCYELTGCTGAVGEGYKCESATFQGLDCNGYRLPMEVEWEIAARAKTTTPLYSGEITLKGDNHAPELDVIAWYGGNSGVDDRYAGGHDCSGWTEKQYVSQTCGTQPVRRKQPNAWWLYDVLGNVFEWCTDWYGSYDPDVQPIDRTGPVRGSSRVIRGGSWNDNARYVRAASRHRLAPSNRWYFLGFRLARGQVLRSSEAEPRGR